MVVFIQLMDVTTHILSQEHILENLALYQSQMDDKLIDEPTQIMEQLTIAESIMESLILAQNKRWRRVLSMQVERQGGEILPRAADW